MSKTIAVSDLASIESRVAGWLTGCERINQIFAEGKDTYRDFAQSVYGVGYEEVTPDQRHFSKPCVLGSCYQLGADGLMAYAEGYGVAMDKEEAQRLTDLYRSTYPEIPAAWRWLADAFMDVIEHRVLEAKGCGVRIFRDTNFLFMELPSGRRIAYYQPRVEMKVPPWERKKVEDAATLGELYVPTTIPNVTYMGMNQYTRKWERQSTHGGKILENCIAGDTEILTQGGWKAIKDYRPDRDDLWDGEAWVKGGKLLDRGIQTVIDYQGVQLTPDHEVLSVSGWRSAQEMKSNGSTTGFSRQEVLLPNDLRTGRVEPRREIDMASPVRVRKYPGSGRARNDSVEGAQLEVVWVQKEPDDRGREQNPRTERAPGVLGVEIDEVPLSEPQPRSVGKLRWSRDHCVQTVVTLFRGFLWGYGPDVPGGLNTGAEKQRRKLHAEELPVGYLQAASEQPKRESAHKHTTGEDDCVAGGQALWNRAHHDSLSNSPQLAGTPVALEAEVLQCRKERVFDILEAGPRHRFTVRGNSGVVMLVHNCCQAVARDILGYQMLEVENNRPNMDIILHVHDEMGALVEESTAAQDLAELEAIMSTTPPWAPGLILGAEGFISRRYRKD